jgi:hypothetical protein
MCSPRVEGWKDNVFLDPAANSQPASAQALLSLFDSLLWERARVERLFGFRHVFELYVPAAKRVYGYFVLPFLLGDQLVGRVDLKADRTRKVLLVQDAYVEPGAKPAGVVAPLAVELRTMAAWLGLDAVEVGERGELAKPLRLRLAAA